MDLENGLESHSSSSTSPSVEFVRVLDKYPWDNHLKCNYVLKNYQVQGGDRVGIFKIGWKLLKEFVLFEWASVEFSDHVTFTKYRLPHNTTDYYQFCFISGENNVYGASRPFQFYQLYRTLSNMECTELLPSPFNTLDRLELVPNLVENFNGVEPSNNSDESLSECESDESVPDLEPAHTGTKFCVLLPNSKAASNVDEEPEGENDCSEYEDEEEDGSEYEDEEEYEDIDECEGEESDYSDSESMPSLTGYPDAKDKDKSHHDSGDLQSSCGSLPELVMIDSIPELMTDLSTKASNNDNESSFIVTCSVVDEKNVEEEKQEKEYQKLQIVLEHSKIMSENDRQIIVEKSRQIEELMNENQRLRTALNEAKRKNAENDKRNEEKLEIVLEYSKLMSERDRKLLESKNEEIGPLNHQCYCTAIREIQAKQNKFEKEYQQLHTNFNYAKIIGEKDKEIIKTKSDQITNLIQANQHYRDMLDKTNGEFKEEVEGLYGECDELKAKFESVHTEITEGISQLKLETENLNKSMNTKENEFLTSTDSMKIDMLKLNNITKEFETRFHSQEQQILNLLMSVTKCNEDYKKMMSDNEDLRTACSMVKSIVSHLVVIKNAHADIGELKPLPPLPQL